MSKPYAVVILSGGMDSTVLLYEALDLYSDKHSVHALSVNYGQRHRKELMAAGAICRQLGVTHEVADLQNIRHLLAGSSQTDDIPVPHGHYAAENMKVTVVPNRNMIMLSVAGGYAISIGAEVVMYGAHKGDHTIYPDCRREFVLSLAEAFKQCHFHPVKLFAPFIDCTKAEIAKIGAKLNVPFELTWSCYEGGAKHCGKCGTCVERKEAFATSGVPDPTEYALP